MRSLLRPALLLAAMIAVASCADPRSILYVGPERVECTGVGPQLCLLVKERPDADWEYFYEGLEGFAYEPGYTYKLLVRKGRVENPAADASSIRWRLIRILEKRRAS
jgi:hypothetical protein